MTETTAPRTSPMTIRRPSLVDRRHAAALGRAGDAEEIAGALPLTGRTAVILSREATDDDRRDAQDVRLRELSLPSAAPIGSATDAAPATA